MVSISYSCNLSCLLWLCCHQLPKHYIEIWHERPFSLQNSQFNLICKLSNLRHHIFINSCLILFCLACLLLKLTSIYHMWQDLLYLRLCISISHLIHKIFTFTLNPIIDRNKPSQILEPLYQSWILCSIFLFLFCLSHIYYANGIITLACNTWAISFSTIYSINFLLIISCKQVSPLIVLSDNAPKPTRGLDALSISPFLVIDDNTIKA